MLSGIQQTTQVYAPEPAAGRATAASQESFSAALKRETAVPSGQDLGTIVGMFQIFAAERAGSDTSLDPPAAAPAAPAAETPFVPQFRTDVKVVNAFMASLRP
jgi:hypothetical protein